MKIMIKYIPKNYFSSRAQYSLIAESEEHRKEVINWLSNKKIPSMIYYKYPLHLLGAFNYLGYKVGDFKVAEKISKQIFSLPMHPYMTKEDQDIVIGIVNG